MKKVLVLSDNEEMAIFFKGIVKRKKELNELRADFSYKCSHGSKLNKLEWVKEINIKDKKHVVDKFDLIISLHCKQLFPEYVVRKKRCINIHPGLNPHNRGFYPQVFSIINGLPCGATIHEIDEKVDNGPVICQKEIHINPTDTSLTAYRKIIRAEKELIKEHLVEIINADYTAFDTSRGNLNLKKDFDDLCEINLSDIDSFENHINKLRALTHGDYKNAYFEKEDKKIYIKIDLEEE